MAPSIKQHGQKGQAAKYSKCGVTTWVVTQKESDIINSWKYISTSTSISAPISIYPSISICTERVIFHTQKSRGVGEATEERNKNGQSLTTETED